MRTAVLIVGSLIIFAGVLTCSTVKDDWQEANLPANLPRAPEIR
jgi:hypothetical protein